MIQSSIVAADNPVAVVSRPAITAAIATAVQFVESKNAAPILTCVHFSHDAGQLKLSATDLDVQIEILVDADVDMRFEASVPAHLFADMTKKAPASDNVVMTAVIDPDPRPTATQEGDNAPSVLHLTNMTAQFGKASYRMNSVDDDFPAFQEDKYPVKFGIAASVLHNAIHSVFGAVSTEETRYYLNGVFLSYFERTGMMRTVATDGHRAYIQEFDAPRGAEKIAGHIIPAKTCRLLLKLLGAKDSPRDVQIKINENRIVIEWQGVKITSKLIDGTFPDYVRVFPTGNEKTAEFRPKQLLEGVAAVTVISSERGRAVKLTLTNNRCDLMVKNPDAGDATYDIPVEYDGKGDDQFDLGLNAKYLTQIILAACPDKSGRFTMRLGEVGSPVLMTGSQHGWLGVLMPMRV